MLNIVVISKHHLKRKGERNGCEGNKVKYVAIKQAASPVLFFETWRWTAGTKPDHFCQLCSSWASLSAIVKVKENGWTPPLIPGTLRGIRADTRTRTSVISLFSFSILSTICQHALDTLSILSLPPQVFLPKHTNIISLAYTHILCRFMWMTNAQHVQSFQCVCVNVWGCHSS